MLFSQQLLSGYSEHYVRKVEVGPFFLTGISLRYKRISRFPTPAWYTGLRVGPARPALSLWVLNLVHSQPLFSTRRWLQLNRHIQVVAPFMGVNHVPDTVLSTLPALFHTVLTQKPVWQALLLSVSLAGEPRQRTK